MFGLKLIKQKEWEESTQYRLLKLIDALLDEAISTKKRLLIQDNKIELLQDRLDLLSRAICRIDNKDSSFKADLIV